MCEILFIMKTDNKNISKNELKEFLFKALNSANKNPDGYGVMCETWYLKSPLKLEIKDIENILKEYKDDSRFFAIHTRLATCDINEKFTHPFKFNSFMGMHNGVIITPRDYNGSDSLYMFKTIDKQNGLTLKDKIVMGMQKITGSYSVLMYSDNDKCLYYYRNGLSFDFMLNDKDNILYGATDINRLKTLLPKKYGFFEYGYEKTPETHKIYKIDLKNGFISITGKILEMEKQQTKFSYSKKTKHDWSWWDNE